VHLSPSFRYAYRLCWTRDILLVLLRDFCKCITAGRRVKNQVFTTSRSPSRLTSRHPCKRQNGERSRCCKNYPSMYSSVSTHSSYLSGCVGVRSNESWFLSQHIQNRIAGTYGLARERLLPPTMYVNLFENTNTLIYLYTALCVPFPRSLALILEKPRFHLRSTCVRRHFDKQTFLQWCASACDEVRAYPICRICRYCIDNLCSGIFKATIGFSAPNFQPPKASFFLAKFADYYFFRQYTIMTAMKTSLGEETGLGAHGDVILVTQCLKTSEWTEKKFIWTHGVIRPWGTHFSQQCTNCGRLRSWKAPPFSAQNVPAKYRLTCTFCGASQKIKKPKNLTVDGTMAHSGGQWCFTHRVLNQATAN
jgi:hypothetical protein